MKKRQRPEDQRRGTKARKETISVSMIVLEGGCHLHHVAKDDLVCLICQLILDSRHLTSIDASNQTDKHSIHASNGRRNALSESVPFSCDRLSPVIATETEPLSLVQADVLSARMS